MAQVLSGLRLVAARIPHLASAYPLAPPTFDPEVAPTEIAAVEAELGCTLPADYRAFLESCGRVSAMDVHNGYEILTPSLGLRIRRQDEIPRRVGTHIVFPVAADGGGNLFLLSFDAPFEVWKWNHETGRATNGSLPLGHQALLKVAIGFAAFLQRVLDDWEHFAAGDDAWPFLVG
jgi:hypothetical protein